MLRENKIIQFFKQVKSEAYKIVWPNKRELLSSTAIVCIVVLIISIFCVMLDYTIHNIILLLLNIGK